nr:Sensor-like histidine kinase RcsD [Candidatus Pantoea persica]
MQLSQLDEDETVQDLLDEIALESLPLMRRKGLSLVVNNQQPKDEQRFGDRRALRKVLATLTHDVLTTTCWGKISLTVSADEARPDRLHIELADTGARLTVDELANADFPVPW